MSPEKYFEFDHDALEYRFVEEVGRRTVYAGVTARLLLGCAWAVGWRKILGMDNSDTISSWRYTVLLTVWVSGATWQVISAGLLLREKNFSKHERLKGQQFVATIIIAMVASIMLTEREAKTTLASAVPCILIDGGYMVFEQIRIQSQLQLQAFQILAFLFVEATVFIDKQNVWGAWVDFLIRMPIIVVGQLGISAWLEYRSRAAFVRKHRLPEASLGTFWQYFGQRKELIQSRVRQWQYRIIVGIELSECLEKKGH